MKQNRISMLTIGALLLIFSALYLFTRPAFFTSWDFSNTGQIGDTIGGITAPIINLIGALLVYVSFQAQIEANRIQAKALSDEKQQNFIRNQFEKYILSFEEIKKRLNSVEFIVEHPGQRISNEMASPSVHVTYIGLNAINEYVLRIEEGNVGMGGRYFGQNYNTFGLALTFQFIMKAIYDLIERVELNITDKEDREFFMSEIKLFYNGFLKKFAKRIIECYPNPHESILELSEIKNKIEVKIGS